MGFRGWRAFWRGMGRQRGQNGQNGPNVHRFGPNVENPVNPRLAGSSG